MLLIVATLWYAFIGVIVYLFQKHTRCFSSWNTFTLFMGCTLVFHGVYVPFCLDYPTGRFVPSDYALVRLATNLIAMYVFVLLGVLVVNGTHGFNPWRLDTEVQLSGKGHNPLFFWPITAVFIVLMLYTLAVATVNFNLTHFIYRTLSADEYKQSRILFAESTSRAKGFVFYVAGIASFALFPPLIFFCFYARKYKAGVLYGFLFFGLTVLSVYRALLSGQKAPQLLIIAGIFICHWIATRGLTFNPLNKRLIVPVLLLFLVIIPYMYRVQYPTLDYYGALESAWCRLTVEPNRVLTLYYHVYPEVHRHLWGSSSHLLAKVIGYDGLPPNLHIPLVLFSSPHSCWNAVFIADAWADFGLFGTIASSFIVGALLQWYNVWFARSRKTALVLATYVALILAASKLASCGLLTSFHTFGLVSVFLFFLLVREMGWLQPGRPR